MIDLIQATNGTMTMDDLKNYNVSVKKALNIDYRGYKIFATDAPSSGAVTLSLLKTVEQYPLEDMKDVNLRTHRFDEAMRFAYGARQNLGDPDFIRNIEQYEGEMLSEDKAKYIRSLIRDNETQPVAAYDPTAIYAAESFGTSHIVVTDCSGLTLTSTTTINLLFGAQIMTPETGIILNDEMNDFSIPGVRNAFGYEPSPNNFVAPGKRPLSSITPVIIDFANGTLFFTTGAAGGSRIISSTAQAVWHVIDQDMTMQNAIAAPRFHDQLMPNQMTFEYAFDNNTVMDMKDRGHNVTWVAPGQSAVQGIRRLWNGTFEAASETRQKNSGGMTL
jgi:gamma-glutamyltranspeptidase/glutathione hydrolase